VSRSWDRWAAIFEEAGRDVAETALAFVRRFT
jgi:hypothetical protein